MAVLRLAALIIGITVASGWLIQRVELVYNGPHLAGAGEYAGGAGLSRRATRGFGGRYLSAPIGSVRGIGRCSTWRWQLGCRRLRPGLMHRFLPGLVTGFYGGVCPADRSLLSAS